jgi:hypothetical protein
MGKKVDKSRRKNDAIYAKVAIADQRHEAAIRAREERRRLLRSGLPWWRDDLETQYVTLCSHTRVMLDPPSSQKLDSLRAQLKDVYESDTALERLNKVPGWVS